METVELFQRFSLAVAIGLLIGVERGWQERLDPEGGRSAGLRTLALSGLLGGTWGALASAGGAAGLVALSLAFIVFSLVLAVFRYRETEAEGTFGATTLVAGMLAFALGAYAVLGNQNVAAAAGVVATALLALKRMLHDWLRRLSWLELRSALVLLAMTFLLLPVLPNREVSQLGGLNPYEIWLLTILIAAISFAGYVAVKIVGSERGIVLTALAAGLVSSTAVTVTLARLAKQHPERARLMAGGALIAGATMIARVLAVVAVVEAALLAQLGLPIAAAGVVLMAFAVYLIRSDGGDDNATPIALRNPFELSTVLQFGALLAVIMLATRLVGAFAGDSGLVALAAVSGIADVDAITLSMARQAGGPVSIPAAALAILVAVAVNTVSKALLAWITGGRAAGKPMLVGAALALAAGGAVAVALAYAF